MVDLIIIIWRNNKYITGQVSGVGGFGTTIYNENISFGNVSGYNNATSYCVGTGSFIDACGITITEHVHGLFGHNNWHSAGGAGLRTFLATPASYGITGQSPAASKRVCGWDRNTLGWENPNKNQFDDKFISCGEGVSEVLSDISIQNFPNGGEFILRDHAITGDAVRMKIPHLNWQVVDDVKNQYLWIENRQLIAEYNEQYGYDDQWYYYSGCQVQNPGLFSYIQVGKDINTGIDADVYPALLTSYANKPNALGTYLFPLTAEGSFDFVLDLESTPPLGGSCDWGNDNYIIIKDECLANPFTGYSDLYKQKLDGGDGVLDGVDDLPFGVYKKYTDGTIVNARFDFGDDKDAFTLSGNKKISIGSNPSSTPIYTYRSNPYSAGYPTTILPFENRIIYLNGLSIEILEEIPATFTYDGNLKNVTNIKVKIRWDDYSVDNDVRWCGNIVLQNDVNDPLTRQSQIILKAGKSITLERGKSATQHVNNELIDGEWYFTEPTVLTLKSGTKTTLKSGSSLIIREGSNLIVESGAELIIEQNAVLDIQDNSKLILESGGIIKCTQTNAKILISDGGLLLLNGNNIQLNNANSRIELVSGGTIQTAEEVDFSFTGAGYLNYFNGGNFILGLNSRFDLNSTGPTYRVMQLNDNALLQINGHEVEITNAKIVYKNGSTFKITGTNANFDYVTFTDNNLNAGHAVYAYNTNDLIISHSTLDGFSSAVLLEDIDVCPNDINVKIDYCTFTNHDFAAVEAYNVERMRFYTSTAIGRPSVAAGLFLEDVEECNVQNSNIYDYTVTSEDAAGIFCHKVAALIISGSSIHDNEDGIETRATNIFVRNGGVIKENTTGIYAMSSHDGFTNPDMDVPYMIVVGDIECGWIINNDYGIVATDMTLDIDQIQHANDSPYPFYLHPNRFDGNIIKTFLMCFDFFSDVNENVMARHNYWTGGIYPISEFEIGYNPSCDGFDYDASDFRTTQPTTCNCYGLICASENTYENIQLRLSETSCNEMITKQGGGQISIANQFRDGYLLFSSGAYNYAYQKFNWLNNRVSQERGTAGLPDGICKSIHQSSIMFKELSDILATVYCQYPFWIEEREEIIEEHYSTKFLIFPNPAQTIITLGSLDGSNASYQILSMAGLEIYGGNISGSTTIDISDYPKGVYLVIFKDDNSNIIETQKVILQ